MEVSELKRDPLLLLKALEVQPDGSVKAKRDLEVHLPKRFVDNGMATIGESVTTSAILGIVLPGESYALFSAMADVTLFPLSIREQAVKGNVYEVLEFSAGDTVIESLTILQDPHKSYEYTLEFYFYAKLPWYVSENDVSALFDFAAQQAGAPVGSSPQVVRTYLSLMFRDPDNLDNPYRYSKAMLEGRPPVIVGLNNGPMLIGGTFSKITGGYLADNTIGAIINPDDKVTDLEKIIRGIPV